MIIDGSFYTRRRVRLLSEDEKMAKVTLPCLGIEAAGKVGQGFVFLRWKGNTHVKAWKKPRNPKSTLQTRDRTYLMAAGHFVRFTASNSELAFAVQDAAGPEMPWNSYLIGQIIGPGNEVIDDALLAWDEAENAETWTSEAELLGMQDQKHPNAVIDTITKGEILFLGANAAYNMGLSWAPALPAEMTDEQIGDFVEAMAMGGKEIP